MSTTLLRWSLPLLLALATPDAQAATLSGTVYRDIDADGVRDNTSAIPGLQSEFGLADVQVVAYGPAGTALASTTSSLLGAYSLSVPDNTQVRLEFTLPGHLFPSATTASNNVRFFNSGTGTVTQDLAAYVPTQYCEQNDGLTNRDVRLITPSYVQDRRDANPGVVNTIMNFGYGDDPATTLTNAAGPNTPNVDAVKATVGSVWGLAYHRRANRLLAGAYLKRHVELGRGLLLDTTSPPTNPNNTGVLYLLPISTSGGTPPDPVVFADLNEIAGAAVAGAQPRVNPTPGGFDFYHDTGAGTTTASAAELFRAVGKVGLGGIKLAEDERTLYVVSLGDRRLYQLDSAGLFSNANPTTDQRQTSFKHPAVDIPRSGCANPADARPFALKVYDGYVYVGVTCTAESTINLIDPSIISSGAAGAATTRGDRTQLKALVYRFNPATQSFDDPAGLPPNPVVDLPLTYPRGCISGAGTEGHGRPTDSGSCADNANGTTRADWLPWQPNWQAVFGHNIGGNTYPPLSSSANYYYIEYPQPLLVDLEFDNRGAMVLGLRDLNGDRTGFCAGSPLITENAGGAFANCTDPAAGVDSGTHRGNGEGDILRVCFDTGSNRFVPESNGSCGGLATGNPLPSSATPGQNGQGPGTPGGEYYWGDLGPGGFKTTTGGGNVQTVGGLGANNASGGHGETVMGSLAGSLSPNLPINTTSSQVTGSFIISNAIDSRNFYDGGLVFFNNVSNGTATVGGTSFNFRAGGSAKRMAVYASEPLRAGKSNGLGDIELLCRTQPPTIIGNRVWTDSNGNGLQDAGEAGINNVTVELWRGNVLVGRTTTNASGEYYFTIRESTAADGSTTDADVRQTSPYGGNPYTLYLPQSQSADLVSTGTSGALAGLVRTAANALSGAGSALRDSDGLFGIDPDAGGAQVARVGRSFTLDDAGASHHDYDFGFLSTSSGSGVADLSVTIDDGRTDCNATVPTSYTIIASNKANPASTLNAVNVPLSVTLPPNVTATTWTCVNHAGTATCGAAAGSGSPNGATFSANPGGAVRYVVNLGIGSACPHPGGQTATAAVPVVVPTSSGNRTDPTPGDNTSSDTDLPGGDLSISLNSAATQFCSGQTLTYTLIVANSAGSATARGVGVSLPLGDPPFNPGLTHWAVTATSGGASVVNGSSGGVPLASTVDLPAGSSVTYTVNAYVRSSYDTSPLTQTATLSVPGGYLDSNPANNSNSESDTFCGGQPRAISFCATPGKDAIPTAPLTGTVNSYWPVTASIAAHTNNGNGTQCVAGDVQLALGTRRGAAVDLTVGDLVLVVQMQGATWDTSDSADYGDGPGGATASGYVSRVAGQHEFAVVTRNQAGGGGSGTGVVCLDGSGNNGGLRYAYSNQNGTTTTAQQRFQLIRVPQYSNAIIGTTAVTAPAWDGSSGGIVALDVQNQLSFASGGQINVSGLGFRGGPAAEREGVAGGVNAGYRAASAAPAGCHGAKGEGMAGAPVTLGAGNGYPNGSGADGSLARGAPGNAGGGGNDGNCTSATTNNSRDAGGGGAGSVCASGGQGGNNTADPGLGGFGGSGVLASATGPQMLMTLNPGGGGGAGQTDSATVAANTGAAGGGVVILRAGSIVGSGTINASGAALGATGATGNGGGGGGGAGGQVILATDPVGPGNLSGLSVNLSGGTGGGVTGNNGAGGGGAAGCLVSSSTLPGTLTLTGGNAGAPGTGTAGAAGGVGQGFSQIPVVDNNQGAQPGYLCGNSTVPVTLSKVQISDLGNGRLRFGFATASEVGSAGFHLIQRGADGRRVQLNSDRIGARAQPFMPADYSLDVSADRTAEFYIEEVATGGETTAYGPYRVNQTLGAVAELHTIDWPAVHAEVRGQMQVYRAALGQAARGTTARAELTVDRDGWQRIRHEALLAIGIDYSGTPASHVRVRQGQQDVRAELEGGAVWGPGSALVFPAFAVRDSLYTRTAVYTVDVAGQAVARLPVLPADAGDGAAEYTATLHLERLADDLEYGIDSPLADPWYLRRLVRNGLSPVSTAFNLPVPGWTSPRAIGQERVLVSLYGGLDYASNPQDHYVQVLLDGHLVGESRFDGLSAQPLAFEVSGRLGPGPHSVELRLPADTGETSDRVNIESVALQYLRGLNLTEARLEFTAQLALQGPAPTGLYADGFESGLASKRAGACDPATLRSCAQYRVLGVPDSGWRLLHLRNGVPLQRLQTNVDAGVLRFATLEQSVDTYVLDTQVQEPVLQVAPPLDAGLLSGAVDYVAIAHPAFLTGAARVELDRLLAQRQSEGLRVRLVDVTQVYRQFGAGHADPAALEAYLDAAHLQQGLRYVLLVGGDTYDPLNHTGAQSISFIPSPYRRTGPYVAFAPVDAVYADVGNDGRYELAVGRLPVRTAEELRHVVDKTLRYGVANPLPRAVLVADRRSSSDAISFRAVSEGVGQVLPAGWSTAAPVYLDLYPADAGGTAMARNDLAAAVNAGARLTQYFGHSAPAIWSRERLLQSGQIQTGLFSNAANPTVIAQYGCWGSYHVVPQYNTVAHAWLLGAQGAAALVGASALTVTDHDERMARAFAGALGSQPGARLGDVLRAALAALADLSAAEDVVLGTTLLGDPALPMGD